MAATWINALRLTEPIKRGVWVLAVEFYQIWKSSNEPKHTAFCKFVGLNPTKYNNLFQNLIPRFFTNWIPNEDDKYMEWRNGIEDKDSYRSLFSNV